VKGRPSACRFGVALAYFDLANLIIFPISTALGLYGFVVYRHPQTISALAEVGVPPRKPILLAVVDGLRCVLAIAAGAIVSWVGANSGILGPPQSYLGTQILLLPSWVIQTAGVSLFALGGIWGVRAVLAFLPGRLPRFLSRAVAVLDLVLIPFYPLGLWLGIHALGVLPRASRPAGGAGPT
jgi:hypothetical protein